MVMRGGWRPGHFVRRRKPMQATDRSTDPRRARRRRRCGTCGCRTPRRTAKRRERTERPPKDELVIPADDARPAVRRNLSNADCSTDFSKDSGGLLVGFGRRRTAGEATTIPSKPSNITAAAAARRQATRRWERAKTAGATRAAGAGPYRPAAPRRARATSPAARRA